MQKVFCTCVGPNSPKSESRVKVDQLGLQYDNSWYSATWFTCFLNLMRENFHVVFSGHLWKTIQLLDLKQFILTVIDVFLVAGHVFLVAGHLEEVQL